MIISKQTWTPLSNHTPPWKKLLSFGEVQRMHHRPNLHRCPKRGAVEGKGTTMDAIIRIGSRDLCIMFRKRRSFFYIQQKLRRQKDGDPITHAALLVRHSRSTHGGADIFRRYSLCSKEEKQHTLHIEGSRGIVQGS